MTFIDECPYCKGAKQVSTTLYSARDLYSADPVQPIGTLVQPCTTCKGWGFIFSPDHAAQFGSFPKEEMAARQIVQVIRAGWN